MMAKEIQLTQGQVAIVDDVDFERLNQHKWHAFWNAGTRSFYAKRNIRVSGKCVSIWMHRVIMAAPPRAKVDHRESGKTLLNVRSNLRLASSLQNCRNARLRKDNRSGLKGVRRATKESVTYQARIKINGQPKLIGTFVTPELAARAYDREALLHFGEFALLNFPEEHANG